MPTKFMLHHRIGGFAVSAAAPGEPVSVCVRELIGPTYALHLLERLEYLQNSIFSKIPNIPPPSLSDHILVLIDRDLSAVAYVNELSFVAEVKVSRPVEAGAPIFSHDIQDITAIDLGVEVSPQTGIILVRSFGWRRSLFYDLEPLQPNADGRQYLLDQVLAQQELLLLGIEPHGDMKEGSLAQRLERMSIGVYRLRKLLAEKCQDESQYQELLEQHPWILGSGYTAVERHLGLDNENIPDFTAVRSYDCMRDIIELKHPFVPCFRKNGGFSAAFNEAWDQAERYLGFVHRERNYLREEKQLFFDNPSCILVIGVCFTERQLLEIRRKESLRRTVSVRTYDQLLAAAEHFLGLLRTAGSNSFGVVNKLEGQEVGGSARRRTPASTGQ